jgi:hypothetical protein
VLAPVDTSPGPENAEGTKKRGFTLPVVSTESDKKNRQREDETTKRQGRGRARKKRQGKARVGHHILSRFDVMQSLG